MKTTVLFDLDGTLLDTLSDLTTGTNLALEEQGFPSRTREEVRSFVGNGIGLLIHRALPAGTDPETEGSTLARFKYHYGLHCMDETVPYPGILALLRDLRAEGLHTAIISNKADFAVQQLAERYFSGLLDAAQGEAPPLRRKPAPDMSLAVLDRLGVPRTQAIYVGDSLVDAETAKTAGFSGILVDWGFRSRQELVSAGLPVASHPRELYELILKAARD